MFIKKIAILFEKPSFSALFFLVLAYIRTIIEYTIQKNFGLAVNASVAHSISFYLLCYVITLIIIYLGRKKGINDSFKWTNIVFILLPFPPIVDYYLFNPATVYSYSSIEHFWGNYFTFFNKYTDASPGQKLLGIYIFTTIFICVFKSRKRTFPSLMASLSSYTYTVLISIPWIQHLFPSFSARNIEAVNMSSIALHQKFCIFYIFLSLILLLALWILKDPYILKPLINTLSPVRSLHMIQMGWFGLIQSDIAVLPDFFLSNIIILTISILFAWWLIALVNDYYDIDIDKISNRNRLLVAVPKYKTSLTGWLYWIGLFSILSTISVGVTPAVIISIYIAGGLIYSIPPIRLRYYIFSPSFIGIGSMLLYLFGSSYYIVSINQWLTKINYTSVLILLFAFSLSAYIKDEKDRNSDRVDNIKTLFTLFDYKKAKTISTIFLFSGWTMLYIFVNGMLLNMIYFSCIAATIYISYKQKSAMWHIINFQIFIFINNIVCLSDKKFILF